MYDPTAKAVGKLAYNLACYLHVGVTICEHAQ